MTDILFLEIHPDEIIGQEHENIFILENIISGLRQEKGINKRIIEYTVKIHPYIGLKRIP